MSEIRFRITIAWTVAVLAVVMMQSLGRAELPDPTASTVTVGLNTGPVVAQGRAGFDATGIAATVASATPPITTGAQGSDAGPVFTYVPIPDNMTVGPAAPPVVRGGVIVTARPQSQPACSAGQTGYYVYDANGQFAGIVCVPAAAPSPATPQATLEIALAQEASSRQPWPQLKVGVSPDIGLTGLDSWFWLVGTATMPQASATAGPLTVTVRAALVDVLWDFGDGDRFDSGLEVGQAFPSRSGIRHVYQTDSYRRPNGYAVLANLRFGVWYSVNSGPWRYLGTKVRSYNRPYLVNQIQPEGVPSKP